MLGGDSASPRIVTEVDSVYSYELRQGQEAQRRGEPLRNSFSTCHTQFSFILNFYFTYICIF